VETNKFQYLYKEEDEFNFMNVDDFNQIVVSKNSIENSDLLKEGEIVSISINSEDGLPLSVDMPASVILEIKHTEPGIKGNTATNASKPATVETGAKINVPLFINEGDKIKVDTEKASYIERIKE
jgi:elongation factor P